MVRSGSKCRFVSLGKFRISSQFIIQGLVQKFSGSKFKRLKYASEVQNPDSIIKVQGLIFDSSWFGNSEFNFQFFISEEYFKLGSE